MSTTSEIKNHLIIGLGGTGGRVLRAFRKSIYQEFGTNRPVIEGLKLTYLYVDSSEELMKFDDPSWKIIGKSESTQLGSDLQVRIKGADLTSRLENIKNYPGIQHWIGSCAQWCDILGGTIGDILGGQKRRLGRFLFSCKAPEFRDQVQKLVSQMENSGSEGATFHICCGLAGGTGSGSVVDVVSQIRNLYRRDKDEQGRKGYRIRIYAYLPESHPKKGWDAGNYHANGYAALLELNALSVGSWVPHDVTGLTSRADPTSQLSPSEKARFEKRNLPNPFTGCYLYTNVNDSGVKLDIETELPAVVSDFLYQIIITARAVKLDALDKMENVENRSDTAELNEKTKEKLRSKAFLSFGIKRIAVPEEEIKEYLTSQFACQAALQLSFCNWPDQTQVGFTKDERGNNFPIFVTLKETLARWKMSDEHLTQSLGILLDDTNSKDWKTLPNEWQSLAAGFKDIARQGDDGKWLDRLETLYNDRFNDNFRKMGVKRFYQVKLRSRRDIIREIRNVIEAELFAQVKNGEKSVPEVGLLITALINHTEERLQGVAAEIQKQRDKEPGEAAAVSANKGDWAKLGPFSRMFLKKHERLLDAQSLCLERLYITRTQIEAWDFAKQLLRDLVTELNDLKVEVDRCATTIAAGLKFFEDSCISLCADKGEMDLRQNVIRFYEPDKVREVAKSFIKDYDQQRTQTSAVRAKLAAELGAKETFENFNLRIGREKFIEICQCQCAESVEDVHGAFVRDARGKGRLFGVNIIEKLDERYGSNPTDLKALITELVEHSGVLLPFDTTEIDKANDPTILKSMPPDQLFLVIRPQDPARKTFLNMLETEFRDYCKGNTVIFTDSVGKSNEIALIRITNFFPLRFVEPLRFLKEKYDQRINEVNAERAKLEIHLEGDGSQHPSLYAQSSFEAKLQGLPYVLLAKSLGLIETTENKTTGLKQLALIRRNNDGVKMNPIFLGKTTADAWEALDNTATDQIQQDVNAALRKVENLHVEKRRALQEAIVADLNAFLESRGNDLTDPICKQFRDATLKAISILKGEG